jgi:hypothetical protein
MAASFYSSPLIGATTTLACFAHEIPHEIADYSILVRSGFSKRQAMQSQYITAVGAFVRCHGFFCSVLQCSRFNIPLINLFFSFMALVLCSYRLGENSIHSPLCFELMRPPLTSPTEPKRTHAKLCQIKMHLHFECFAPVSGRIRTMEPKHVHGHPNSQYFGFERCWRFRSFFVRLVCSGEARSKRPSWDECPTCRFGASL